MDKRHSYRTAQMAVDLHLVYAGKLLAQKGDFIAIEYRGQLPDGHHVYNATQNGVDFSVLETEICRPVL